MNTELEAIKEAQEPLDSEGNFDKSRQDMDEARSLGKAYVLANTNEFPESDYASRTVEELVAAVDVFRAAGMLDAQWRVEAWLLFRYAPQNIGGTVQPAIINELPAEEAPAVKHRAAAKKGA